MNDRKKTTHIYDPKNPGWVDLLIRTSPASRNGNCASVPFEIVFASKDESADEITDPVQVSGVAQMTLDTTWGNSWNEAGSGLVDMVGSRVAKRLEHLIPDDHRLNNIFKLLIHACDAELVADRSQAHLVGDRVRRDDGRIGDVVEVKPNGQLFVVWLSGRDAADTVPQESVELMV